MSIDADQAITVTVTDEDGVGFVAITANGDLVYVSVDGEQIAEGDFQAGYSGTRGAVTDGFEYIFARTAGWDGGPLTVVAHAVDAEGQFASETNLYSVNQVVPETEPTTQLPLSVADGFKTVEIGEALYLAGAILLQYDGISAIESNFLEFSETDDLRAVSSIGGGSLTPSTETPVAPSPIGNVFVLNDRYENNTDIVSGAPMPFRNFMRLDDPADMANFSVGMRLVVGESADGSDVLNVPFLTVLSLVTDASGIQWIESPQWHTALGLGMRPQSLGRYGFSSNGINNFTTVDTNELFQPGMTLDLLSHNDLSPFGTQSPSEAVDTVTPPVTVTLASSDVSWLAELEGPGGFIDIPYIVETGGVGFYIFNAEDLNVVANHTYGYQVIPEWTNARGEKERGTNSGAKVVTMGIDHNTVTLTIPTISMTLKKGSRDDIVFGVYRTVADPTSDAPFFRVGQVQNDPTVFTVEFEDLLSDTIIKKFEQFYLGTGELDNLSSQGGHVMCLGGGRVFVAGFVDVNQIAASKVKFPGVGLAFNDVLLIQAPDAGGRIMAMEFMNESLIIFKETAIYRVRGDGPNNAGTGSFFSPEVLSSDAGSTGQFGVVVTPLGLMFQSQKGLMLLDQSFQVQYFGASVEGLIDNLVACKSAVLVPDLQHVRFTFESDTVVYDYFHKQWYRYTHGSLGPCVLWNRRHAALTDGGVVYDDPGVFLDVAAPYTMRLVLSWAKDTRTTQGDLAIRRVGLTGTSLAAHDTHVDLRYDYLTDIAQSIERSPIAAGRLVFNERTVNQFCSALEMEITDALDGEDPQATAGVRLNEMTMEVAVRRGGTFGRLG